jgi:uncharacterized protein (TIGR02285 family)
MHRFCLFIFVAIFSAQGQSSVKIIYDFEPFTNTLATGIPTGTASATAFLILKDIQMPHDYEHLPFTRLHAEMKRTDEAICALFTLKNDKRESQFIFSLPMAFQSSQRLFMHAQLPNLASHLLSASLEVKSLSDLMATYPKSLLLVTKGISQGQYLDQEMAKINPLQIQVSQGFNTSGQQAKLFLRGRADFTVAFPSDIRKHADEYSNVNFKGYNIANNPKYMTSHLMCNKTRESSVFVEQINAAIIALYSQASFYEAHTTYLPVDERMQAIEYINQYVAKLTERPFTPELENKDF